VSNRNIPDRNSAKAKRMNSHAIENFIDSIHRSHLDNAQNRYRAMKIGRGSTSVSPLTNFVFEFFLFNSLYSINWTESMNTGNLTEHPRDDDLGEAKQQREFVKFCRNQFKHLDSTKMTEAFLPLTRLDDLSSDWTKISPDERITEEQGIRFFTKIAELGTLAKQDALKANKKTFGLIDDCCFFVYQVRNNIFHGAKSIGEIYESNQARRIGVYDLFVRCLNSLFFLSHGKTKHGAALAQLPIVQYVDDEIIDLTIQDVYGLLHRNWLKPEDSVLHWELFRNGVTATTNTLHSKCALFYPSAGRDVLFPLIVGMPYCTDFYFYEQSPNFRAPIVAMLQKINISAEPVDTGKDGTECYEFQFGPTLRRVWVMRRDNKEFLDLDIPVSFFFHRGDSEGEGGSGQRWDSELLPQLLERSSSDVGLRMLTDGEPGGLHDSVKSQLEQVSPPNSHRRRDYFYGVVQQKSS